MSIPEPAAPVPVPPAPPPREEDFSFSFADVEPAAPETPSTPAAPESTAPLAPDSEAEDDLWSEVSLREREAPGVADAALEDEGLWGVAPAAVEQSVGVEDMFEEVTTARLPIAAEPPPAPSPARERFLPPQPTVQSEAAAGAVPAAAPVAPALDQETLERAIAAAVRQTLEPMVGDLAKRLVEQIAWEVVPELAEAMIRAEIERVSRAADTG